MEQKPAVIVLKALLAGQRVRSRSGQTWGLAEDMQLYIVAHDSQGNERLLNNPLRLQTFLILCNELSEDALAELSANAVLNQLNQRGS